jgi:hypothetical protein
MSRIWTFGAFDAKANLMVDTCKGVQFLNEIKDSCVGAFLQVSSLFLSLVYIF